MGSTEHFLAEVFKSAGSGKPVPALKLTQTAPELAALISKLVRPPMEQRLSNRGEVSDRAIDLSRVANISRESANRLTDGEHIVELLPDTEMAIQIVVSSILSPKDMLRTELNYSNDGGVVPPSLLTELNTIVKTAFETNYGILNELNDMLRNALFMKGSVVKAVLPESTVDQLINQHSPRVSASVAVEAMSSVYEPDVNGKMDMSKVKPMGILGSPGESKRTNTSMESIFSGMLDEKIDYDPTVKGMIKVNGLAAAKEIVSLKVYDNYELLKVPKAVEALRKSRMNSRFSRFSASLEAEKSMAVYEIDRVFYKNPKAQMQTLAVVSPDTKSYRKSIGRPLVMELPTESVIPVHIPGRPDEHVGYFVLIDNEGNPISRISAKESLSLANNEQGLSALMSNGCLSSDLLAQTKREIKGCSNVTALQNASIVYGEIVEKDLMERLRNGVYGKEMSLGRNEEIYRIMLARAMASKMTRLVYLPSQLVTYFAFRYLDNGIGKSYLDDMKSLASLRGILLFSKVMAQARSAINVTHVGIKLDAEDPDPQKTIEIAQNEILKTRAASTFPHGAISPADLTSWLHKAGYEFSFSGHPSLPDTEINFENRNINYSAPDESLDETLRKQSYMTFGLSPETVDNGYGSEFAATVITGNALMSKRVLQLQRKFTESLTKYCRTLMRNDQLVIEALTEKVVASFDEIKKFLTEEDKVLLAQDEKLAVARYIENYIDTIVVRLPEPDGTTTQSQAEAFDQYSDFLDKALPAWISTDILDSSITGDASQYVESLKNIFKAYFLRQWMARNNCLPELNELTTLDTGGSPRVDLLEISKSHTEGMMKTIGGFLKKIEKAREKSDKVIGATGAEPSNTLDSGSSFDGSPSDTPAEAELGNLDNAPADVTAGADDKTEDKNTPKDTPVPLTDTDFDDS